MLLKLNEETKSLLISLEDIESTEVAIALDRYADDTEGVYPQLSRHLHEMANAVFMKSLELHQFVKESEEFHADTQ